MKKESAEKTLVQQMVKDVDTFIFNHPIQRGEEQWNIEQKSKLIDSILRGYIIDPARAIVTTKVENGETIKDKKGNDKEFYIIIDGKQRMTTIIDFVQNKFKLSKHIADLPPYDIKDETYNPADLVGLTFDELPDIVKDEIKGYCFHIHYLINVSDWDLREMFKRQNGGKALTKAQLNSAKISLEMYNYIQSILHADGCKVTYERVNKKGETVVKEKELPNFWNRFLGNGVFKNGEDRNIVLSTMMFISRYNDFNFGLLNDDIENFIDWFDAKKDEEKAATVNAVIEAADAINERIAYGEKIPNLKKTSIPMVVAGMAKVIKNKGGKDYYMSQIKEFFNNYSENYDYKELVGSGSASKEKVQARWEVFKEFAKKKSTSVVEETTAE